MKKSKKKLSLNKEVVANLDKEDLANIKGGFTYSLSTGYRCKVSKSLDAKNPLECGYKWPQEL
jgi:natural product precursor